MIRKILKSFLIVGTVLLAVPTTLQAQQKKADDKSEVQQIIITRTGDKNEKTVIEIQGDKVKVNGKEVADNKDVNVRVNSVKGVTGARSMNVYTPGSHGNTVINGRSVLAPTTIYSLDSNRAMLGIVTEGKKDAGASIVSVNKGSAAEKAGLKKGDVLTSIGSKKIESTDDVTKAVRAHKPGDKVTIAFTREGKAQTATAELDKWKGINFTTVTAPRILDNQIYRESLEDRMKDFKVPDFDFDGGSFYFNNRPKLGLSIQDSEDGKGVKVLEVDDDSNAAKAGVAKDDVITHFDDKAVNSTDEISKYLREKKDHSSYRLQILRGGKTQNIEVKMPKKTKTMDI